MWSPISVQRGCNAGAESVMRLLCVFWDAERRQTASGPACDPDLPVPKGEGAVRCSGRHARKDGRAGLAVPGEGGAWSGCQRIANWLIDQ